MIRDLLYVEHVVYVFFEQRLLGILRRGLLLVGLVAFLHAE